jgi:hypothetical protein
MIESWHLILIAIVLLTMAADIYMTNKATSGGRASEGNPVSRFIMNYLGDKWWVAKVIQGFALGAIGLWLLTHDESLLGVLVLAGSFVLHGYTAFSNYRVWKRRS